MDEEFLKYKAKSTLRLAKLEKDLIDKNAAIDNLEDKVRYLQDKLRCLERQVQQPSGPNASSTSTSRSTRSGEPAPDRTSIGGNDRPPSAINTTSVIDLSLLDDSDEEEKPHGLASETLQPSAKGKERAQSVQQLPSPASAVESRKRDREAGLTDMEDDDDLYLDHSDHNVTPIKSEARSSSSPLTDPPTTPRHSLIEITGKQEDMGNAKMHPSSSPQKEKGETRSPSRKRQKFDCVIIEKSPTQIYAIDDRAVSVQPPRILKSEVGDLPGTSSVPIDATRSPTTHEQEHSNDHDTKASSLTPQDSVARRLNRLATYPVSVDSAVIFHNRDFLQKHIKVPTQALCATVRPTSNNLPINRNGDRSEWGVFLPQRDINLYLPRRPGQPGLLCMMRTELVNGKSWSLFCKEGVNGADWGYYGDYVLKWTDSLTTEEWNRHSRTMHSKWAKTIWERKTDNWGPAQRCRARIALRKKGAALSESAIIEEVKKSSHLEIADVHEAFRKGEEQLGLVQLECVSFNHQFQRSLADLYSGCTKPAPRPKESKGEKQASKKGTGNKKSKKGR